MAKQTLALTVGSSGLPTPVHRISPQRACLGGAGLSVWEAELGPSRHQCPAVSSTNQEASESFDDLFHPTAR